MALPRQWPWLMPLLKQQRKLANQRLRKQRRRKQLEKANEGSRMQTSQLLECLTSSTRLRRTWECHPTTACPTALALLECLLRKDRTPRVLLILLLLHHHTTDTVLLLLMDPALPTSTHLLRISWALRHMLRRPMRLQITPTSMVILTIRLRCPLKRNPPRRSDLLSSSNHHLRHNNRLKLSRSLSVSPCQVPQCPQ